MWRASTQTHTHTTTNTTVCRSDFDHAPVGPVLQHLRLVDNLEGRKYGDHYYVDVVEHFVSAKMTDFLVHTHRDLRTLRGILSRTNQRGSVHKVPFFEHDGQTRKRRFSEASLVRPARDCCVLSESPPGAASSPLPRTPDARTSSSLYAERHGGIAVCCPRHCFWALPGCAPTRLLYASMCSD